MCPDSDEYTTERFIELREPIPKWQALIDRCRDEDECEALCQQVIRDIEGGDWDRWLLACELLDDNGVEVLHLHYDDGVACGRRAPGVAEHAHACAPNPVGDYFAQTARLEAEAVIAFRHLARELAAHGAPRNLIEAAKRAARDEVRHTALTAQLARRWGAAPTSPQASTAPVRSLLDLAVDNAAEGCIRETYGAVVALWQSQAAADPAVRAAMVPIAADESGHAELSWRIDDWARAQLTNTERAAVAAAKRESAARLRAGLDVEIPSSVSAAAGLPARARAIALLDETLRAVAVA